MLTEYKVAKIGRLGRNSASGRTFYEEELINNLYIISLTITYKRGKIRKVSKDKYYSFLYSRIRWPNIFLYIYLAIFRLLSIIPKGSDYYKEYNGSGIKDGFIYGGCVRRGK